MKAQKSLTILIELEFGDDLKDSQKWTLSYIKIYPD